ncbi:DUF397 domain-containing protein [Spirillospora sp. NPDC048824]|uniref:DUF397 domain-containing protein n=1 Tax=Spirillospora sp. NPDC048824 TaxID=3364526 RepID=UPI003720C6F2
MKKFTSWRVSSYTEAGGSCVEAGKSSVGTIGVRDSTVHGKGPILELTRTQWAALLNSIRPS